MRAVARDFFIYGKATAHGLFLRPRLCSRWAPALLVAILSLALPLPLFVTREKLRESLSLGKKFQEEH